MLKRENRRVHLVAFMDDHSRFIVGYGLHASASGALVREVLEAAIANFGAPEEVLTDNGPQYKTWRGTSAFTRLLERRGHPPDRGGAAGTRRRLARRSGSGGRCGGSSSRRRCSRGSRTRGVGSGCSSTTTTSSARTRASTALVPADRYFQAAKEVKATLAGAGGERTRRTSRRTGSPRKPFYLTGRVGDRQISLHAEGEKVVLMQEGGAREEVDLSAPGQRAEPDAPTELPTPVAVTAVVPDLADLDDEDVDERPPGASPLDGVIEERPLPRADEPEAPSAPVAPTGPRAPFSPLAGGAS